MIAGIYCIENLLNGKKYIGQGIKVEKRMRQYHGECDIVYKAIKKYGKENFKKYIILYCEPDKKILAYYEIACIKIFHSHVSEGGYNITWGGISPMTGRKHSKKTKQKISVARLGQYPSEETRQQMSEARLGEKNPMFGKHRSGKKAPFFGKHHTSESRQKISEANLGKHHA